MVRFHPDSFRLLLLAADDEYNIRVWKLDSSSCVAVLRGHFSAVTAMQFTADGSLLFRWVCSCMTTGDCNDGLLDFSFTFLCPVVFLSVFTLHVQKGSDS